jgi:hypothetical protein
MPGWQWERKCPGAASEFSVCKPCPSLPGNGTWAPVTEDPIYPRALEECVFDCRQGFYHADDECRPCTARVCPAGYRLTACTSSSDSHCDTECVDETKPSFHSHWKIGPNCPWACDDGYVSQTWDYAVFTVHECVLAGGA